MSESEQEEENEEDIGDDLSFSHNSWITHVKYNTKSKRMMVNTQKGDSYELEGVSLETYLEFASAPSKGSYFNRNLKGKYSHKYFE